MKYKNTNVLPCIKLELSVHYEIIKWRFALAKLIWDLHVANLIIVFISCYPYIISVGVTYFRSNYFFSNFDKVVSSLLAHKYCRLQLYEDNFIISHEKQTISLDITILTLLSHEMKFSFNLWTNLT